MNVSRFQQIAEKLLQKHYGLELNDTHLYDDAIVAHCMTQGFLPFQVIAEHAYEANLDRVDLEEFCGVRSQAAITAADEDAAIAELDTQATEMKG